MIHIFSKSQIALAVAAALGTTAIATAPGTASAGKPAGTYVTGDFHNHTTCSDGSISMQKLVKKATDTGTGCAPITAPGATGIRGDNAEFTVDDYTVRAQ